MPRLLEAKKDVVSLSLIHIWVEYSDLNRVPFGSSYFCHKVLPKQIVFENLATVKGERSRMWADMEKFKMF